MTLRDLREQIAALGTELDTLPIICRHEGEGLVPLVGVEVFNGQPMLTVTTDLDPEQDGDEWR